MVLQLSVKPVRQFPQLVCVTTAPMTSIRMWPCQTRTPTAHIVAMEEAPCLPSRHQRATVNVSQLGGRWNESCFEMHTFLCRHSGGGFILACEDFGRMFNHLFSSCAFLLFFFLFFKVEISSHTLIPLFVIMIVMMKHFFIAQFPEKKGLKAIHNRHRHRHTHTHIHTCTQAYTHTHAQAYTHTTIPTKWG